jgi:hypothetical protein
MPAHIRQAMLGRLGFKYLEAMDPVVLDKMGFKKTKNNGDFTKSFQGLLKKASKMLKKRKKPKRRKRTLSKQRKIPTGVKNQTHKEKKNQIAFLTMRIRQGLRQNKISVLRMGAGIMKKKKPGKKGS